MNHSFGTVYINHRFYEIIGIKKGVETCVLAKQLKKNAIYQKSRNFKIEDKNSELMLLFANSFLPKILRKNIVTRFQNNLKQLKESVISPKIQSFQSSK